VLLGADYSQIELRVLAHLSGDAQLIDAFRAGQDIHARTAARIFHCPEPAVTPDQRRTAKVVNFGLLYGMGAFRLSRDLRVPMSEAQSIIDEYFGAFPAVRAYLDGTVRQAREHGFVTMMSGRHRTIEGIASGNRNERAGAERMALNAPIQGTAADVIKVAMVRLRQRLRDSALDARMVLQVHDELLLEVRADHADAVAPIVRETMEQACVLDVPLVVEVKTGRAWSDVH
jgi:DNA polymerase-1